MAKYKILLQTSQKATGLSYHRQLIPHSHLGLNHAEDFEVQSIVGIEHLSDEELKQFQMVHFLREVDREWNFESERIFFRLKKLGIVSVFDIDDYWHLPKNHISFNDYAQYKIPAQVEEILTMADHVTTTTGLLADKIKPFNKNVTVIANAIDPSQEIWQPREIESDLIRFGWIGGVHHLEDIESMRKSFKRIFADKTIYKKFQILLAGFNVTIPISEDTAKDLEIKGFNMEKVLSGDYVTLVREFIKKGYNPPMAEYVRLEKIFTDDYKNIKDAKYLEYLKQFTPFMQHMADDKEYKRLWGRDVWNYADLYNSIDVALVPLLNNEFNNCKSPLKIIEAGFMRKACIVSKVYPYVEDCLDEENCLMVAPGRNHIDFYAKLRRLTLNPDLVFDLGEAMYETVKHKYHIETQNAIRIDLYKHLLK